MGPAVADAARTRGTTVAAGTDRIAGASSQAGAKVCRAREGRHTSHALERPAASASGSASRRQRGALSASLLAHGLALLALVCLLKRSVVLTPPPEPGIAMVFAPAPSPEAARPPPAEPQAAEAQPEEPATPTLPQPEAKTEEPAPPIPEPETPVEQAAPLLPLPEAKTEAAVPPTRQPVPSQHPPPRRVAAARAPALDPRPP